MRFEPRLIRPDDADDSLELPDDLAELAEQLSADADHLAARYPAQGNVQTAAGTDWGRRLVRASAAAVLLTGIGLWGGRLWSGNRPVRPVVDAVLVNEDSHARPVAGDDAEPSSATQLFRSLSGGEQEGVLDLLEEQPSDEAQVSI